MKIQVSYDCRSTLWQKDGYRHLQTLLYPTKVMYWKFQESPSIACDIKIIIRAYALLLVSS